MSVASQKLIARLNARLITRSDDGYVAVTAPRDEPAERDFQLGSVPVVSTPPKSTASREAISADDETAITDIRIAPDGRVFVFGASGQVLEMLSELGWGDDNLQARLEFLKNSVNFTESLPDGE